MILVRGNMKPLLKPKGKKKKKKGKRGKKK